MSQIDLRTVEGLPGIVEHASEDLVSCYADALTERDGIYSVALSGGRVAGPFCTSVGEKLVSRGLLLERLHFFWADERCVPPDDAESNFGVARGALFETLGIPEGQIHRIRGELKPADAVSGASEELGKWVSARQGPCPVLDFVFLGMGEDGHVASLFPGGVATEDLIYTAVRASKPPPERISLTYPMLAAAREVRVLIPGAAKREALVRSMEGEETPLGRVIGAREGTTIITDIDLGWEG